MLPLRAESVVILGNQSQYPAAQEIIGSTWSRFNLSGAVFVAENVSENDLITVVIVIIITRNIVPGAVR